MNWLHRTQIRLLAGFILILSFAAGFLLYQLDAIFRKDALDKAISYHMEIVRGESMLISTALYEGALVGLTLSHSGELSRLLADPGDPVLSEYAHRRLQGFLDRYPEFCAVAVFAADYQLVGSVFQPRVDAAMNRTFWDNLFESGMDPFHAMAKIPVVMDSVQIGAGNTSSRIRYRVPIQDAVGRMMGILVIDQNVGRLLERMDIAAYPFRFFVLDDQGRFLAGNASEDCEQAATSAVDDWTARSAIDPGLVQTILRNRQGHLLLPSAPAELVVYARLIPREQTGLHMTLAQVIPLSRIYAPLRAVQQTLAISVLISFVLMLVLLTVFSARVIQPIRLLADLMRGYRAGAAPELPLRLLQRKDELGQLCGAFADMSVALQRAFADRDWRLLQLEENNAQLERKTEEARSLAKAKSDFLAIMSHEIRTPLNAIVGFAELLIEEDDPDEIEHAKRRITANSRRLLQLVDNILDFTRIQSGKTHLIDEEFSPYTELECLYESFLPAATEKQLQLSFRFEGDRQRMLVGDVLRLRQIITNLLSNALKFTPRGSVSMIAALLPSPEDAAQVTLQVSVEDSGVGIPADRQLQIFRPFEQLENGLQRRFEGSGLGLAIVQKLVEVMGAEIGLVSEPGKGSRFFVRFRFAAAVADAD